MESLVMRGMPMIDAPDLVLLKMIAPFYAISEDAQGMVIMSICKVLTCNITDGRHPAANGGWVYVAMGCACSTRASR